MYVPPLVFTARPHLATRSKGQKKGVGETAGRNVQKTRTAVGHHLTRFLFLAKQRLSAVQQRLPSFFLTPFPAHPVTK